MRENRERLAQIVLVDVLEFVDSGRHEEAFESTNPGIDECVQLRGISRNDAAPEADVDVTLASRSGALLLERGDRGRRGNAVERHVDNRRHASGRGRARGGVEALPL